MTTKNYPNLETLESKLDYIRKSPKDSGVIKLIVRRPTDDEREILMEAILEVDEGLVGDIWHTRGSRRTPDGSAHPDMQIALMNARVIGLMGGTDDEWAMAGDQFFVDLDLSAANLPPGTKLSLGTSILEVTDQPHTGCNKFLERFGADAVKFVNGAKFRNLKLRGIYAKVIQAGEVRTGDMVEVIR